MNQKGHKKMLLGGVVATLSFLPGCMDNAKKDTEVAQVATSNIANKKSLTGEVLVTMRGEPIITTGTVEAYKENLIKTNPQFKQTLQFVPPKELERYLLEGCIGDKIIDEYIVSNKINEKADYKARLSAAYEAAEHMINAQIFTETKSVSVSDSEARSFYEANKDKMQGATISQGGVAATGIEFSDGAAARAFVSRAKTAPGGFKKAAQDDGLTAKIKDFKLVHNQSIGIDAQLKDKITAIKTVPAVEMFEVNDKFWVVNATAKEEPKYVPFEQVKENLKAQLEQGKRIEALTKEIEALKVQYDIQINEDYFAAGDDAQPAGLPMGGMAQNQSVEKKDASEKQLA